VGAQVVIYAILYVVTVAAALTVLLTRDTVKSAMALVFVMVSLAMHFFLMGQEFVGATQIIVYAGAIMVLFLFVIMLLNMREREVTPWYLRTSRFWSGVVALALFILVAIGLNTFDTGSSNNGYVTAPAPAIIDLATLLTTKYALPFILTSVLLLVAVIGAVVMGRRFDPETGEEYLPDDDAVVRAAD